MKCSESQLCPALLVRELDSGDDSGRLFTCFLVHSHGRTRAALPPFSVSPLKELAHILIMSCAVTVYLMTVTFGLSGTSGIEVSDSVNKRSSRTMWSL